LIPIDPARIPLRLALRFHKVGRTRAAKNLFSYFHRGLRAKGPVASLKSMPFQGVASAAMAYDKQPIIDHFRRIDEHRIMGAMVIEGDGGSTSSNLNASDRLGAFSDEGGRGYSAVVRFFCKSSFTKAQGLFLAGANDRIELFDSAVASEELRLSIAEGYLRLLARFAVCLCHSISWIEDRDLSRQ